MLQVRTGKTLSFPISRPQFTKCGETWLGYTVSWATPPLAATMATQKKPCPDQAERGSKPGGGARKSTLVLRIVGAGRPQWAHGTREAVRFKHANIDLQSRLTRPVCCSRRCCSLVKSSIAISSILIAPTVEAPFLVIVRAP